MLHRTYATRIRRYFSQSGAARRQTRRAPISIVEVLEDRALLAAAVLPPEKAENGNFPKAGVVEVFATAETDAVRASGDAADDPAVWVHPTNSSLSLVIGTEKASGGGLHVYDLSGNELQFLSHGEHNNVDVRYGFSLGGATIDIVTVSNQTTDAIDAYRVDVATRRLVAIGSIDVGIAIYGHGLYHSRATGKFYGFATSQTGQVEQWEIKDAGNNRIGGTLVRSFDVGGQTEGTVADDELGNLYFSEEDVGIWKYGADPEDGTARTRVDSTSGSGRLDADVEGLTIYYRRDGLGYLIASSQGAYTYTVYRREGNNQFLGDFSIENGAIDGTTNTDGIDVVSTSLGTGPFANGLFVAQDNTNPGTTQNFKLVPWSSIAANSALGLAIDTTGWDLRGNSTPPPAGPEVTVLGNGTNIVDGDTTPSASDFTNFGSVSQGGAAVSRSFTVRNDGTAPLSLNALTVPAGFTITNNLVSSLAVGASDTITVRLDTATVGTKSGQISFTTNDADESTFNFSISGTVTSAGGTTTVTLQDGVNGYAGTADAHIRGDQSTKNYGTLTGLQMHGNPDKAALIRWNVSTIPTNAVVQSASITVNVTNETNQAFEIYGLLRSWVENQVSWTAAATGNNWATAGAQGASDRGSTVLGSITSPTNGLVTINLNAAGIALLQSWINNPAANNGIVIQDYATTNGLDISSSEIATVASRPKLTITYGTGSSLLAASTPDVLVTETSLTQRSLNTIADAVARRWLAAAPSESRAALRGALDSITFAIADLPDRAIGSSFGNMILIDRNAAGFGWFIDSSPRDDREFSALGIASHGTAEARIDLLTAVAHEVGHLIGLDHSDGGLMSNTLAAGQRKELPAVDATAIDRLFKSLGDANTPLLNFA